jgi:hypothetical protein
MGAATNGGQIKGTRVIALVGPAGAGKTSVAEAMLFAAGATDRLGSTANGSSVGDSSPEARSRGGSTELNLYNFDYLGDSFAVIDCPGSVGFAADGARALALADMAARERGAFRMQTRHKVAAAALGATIGLVLGITSAGSGTLIAIGLILGFRLSPHRVVGTDVAHAAVLLWVAALAHVVSGNVDYGLAGTLLIGSLPGVWVGTHIATKMPQDLLRGALGVVLLASGLGLLSKAGLDVPVIILAGFPVVLAVVVFLLLRRRSPVEVAS